MIKQLTVFLALLLIAGGAQARIAHLKHFFQDVRTYQAKFTQVVLDETSQPVQQSSGSLWIERPGKFRWDYETPFVQQVIGDGERLWVYDRDLKQASVRRLKGALADSPAQWLAGRGDLERDFILRELDRRDGLEWVQLLPRKKDSGFTSAHIGFAQGRLRILELLDGLGQTTRITLHDARENAGIDSARFSFRPSPGVDVISE